MAGPPALSYDAYYHICNRGNNRENIFIESRNYDLFMRLYSRHIQPVADTFAFCLLRNHFHIAVRIKSEREILETLKVSREKVSRPLGSAYPSQQFSNFFNAYAKIINGTYARTGSLFQHPFKRVPITNDRHFWNVIAYIHQNPQKHGFVKDFRDWEWSSYGIIPTDMPTPLTRNAVLDWFGGREQYLELHQQWVSDADSRWFTGKDPD